MTVAMVWCVNVVCVSSLVTGCVYVPYKYANAAKFMYIFVNSLSLSLSLGK